jgi:hypothetical protein
MDDTTLVRMANQIAAFFHASGHDAGVKGTAGHIRSFWDPRMRRQGRRRTGPDGDRCGHRTAEGGPGRNGGTSRLTSHPVSHPMTPKY